MLRRHIDSDFVGGAYVFPGGKVDDEDRSVLAASMCAGMSDAEASALVGVTSGGLAYWVAALRECFEEAGVLLAYREGAESAGELFEPSGVEATHRLAQQRADLNAGATTFLEMCRQNGLRLAADRLAYFSHWIAPELAPVRFDTRFFVAALPPGQIPIHDDHEMVDTIWIRPADGLRQAVSGQLDLIFPTIKHLEAIARFETTAELLAATRATQHVPTILPWIVQRDGEPYIVISNDEGDDEAKRIPAREIDLLGYGMTSWKRVRRA
jgi:8-oxo-dGTP pyrophosphatase MutT (NUDIX family)